MNQLWRNTVLLLCGLVGTSLLLMYHGQIGRQCFHKVCAKCRDTVNMKHIHRDPAFYFVPENVTDCQDLFKTPEGRRFQYPQSYFAIKNDFLTYMANNLPEGTFLEGHSGRFEEQLMAYYNLVNSSKIKTVCETGFNAGHSTVQWLAGNPKVNVYSFDLGWHKYSHIMADYLQKTFPNRFHITWGDSTVTLPEMKRKQPNLVCDLLIVDGGHSFTVAEADLLNMAAFANPEYHILVLDDHPGSKGPEDVWAQQRSQGSIIELFRCCYYFPNFQGFTVGRYVMNSQIGINAKRQRQMSER